MQAFRFPLRFTSLAISFTLIAMASAACDDDGQSGSSTSPPPSSDTDSGTSPPASADAITESVLAACPQSSTLIETTEWPSCLAGRRVSGTEPFNNSPCELRIGANGAFEYVRAGAVALTVPDRSSWTDASGTYQNELNAGRRIFLAGIAPDVPFVEGRPQVTHINLSFFSVASQDETVEIRYLDADRTSQTYNCKVDVL